MYRTPPHEAEDALDEVRAIGRLPGIDIAIVHSPGGPGRAERLRVTIEATRFPGAVSPLAFDPVGSWVQLAQLAWAPWLAMAGTLWGMPRIMGGGWR